MRAQGWAEPPMCLLPSGSRSLWGYLQFKSQVKTGVNASELRCTLARILSYRRVPLSTRGFSKCPQRTLESHRSKNSMRTPQAVGHGFLLRSTALLNSWGPESWHYLQLLAWWLHLEAVSLQIWSAKIKMFWSQSIWYTWMETQTGMLPPSRGPQRWPLDAVGGAYSPWWPGKESVYSLLSDSSL